jgi:hypothetical protein
VLTTPRMSMSAPWPSEPERKRGDEIAGGGVEGSGGALGEGVDAELVRHGELLHPGDDLGNALRQVGGEVAEVTQNGRKAKGEEEGEDGKNRNDEKDDRHAAGGMVAPEAKFGDAADCGHQDHREEGADVEDQQLLLEGPGEREEK